VKKGVTFTITVLPMCRAALCPGDRNSQQRDRRLRCQWLGRCDFM